MKNPFKKASRSSSKEAFLPRLSLAMFNRPRRVALVWLCLVLLGGASYATLLKREGFPSINTPFAIANGSYLVNDPAKVDSDVAKPLSDFLLKDEDVKTVQAQSFGNFYSVIVSYEEDVNSGAKSRELSQEVSKNKLLPSQATLKLAPYEFGFTPRGDDIVVSFYSRDGQATPQELVNKAKQAADFIDGKKLPLVSDAEVIDPFESAVNPLTGATESLFKRVFHDKFLFMP